MAALATSQERSIRVKGREVVVPNHDVCRISYYLRSSTLGCGIDIIVDELVDCRNAHRLSEARQEAVFRLAANEFSASEMLNTTIFLDESGELCGTHENMFFELKKVTNVLAVSSSALVGGKQVEISTIMVFKPSWLERYYLKPLQRWKERNPPGLQQLRLLTSLLEDIMIEDVTSSSNHCDHCKGLDAACGCKQGCPPKESTRCSAVHHCDHCKGIENSACACEDGCPRNQHAKCYILHPSVICDACKAIGLRGSRFMCDECSDYDLCEGCYRSEKHELTHSFSKIERVGSRPIRLRPRQEPRVMDGTAPNSNLFASSSASPAKIAPALTAHKATKDHSEKPITFVGERMSVSQMKDYLTENGVSFVGIRERMELLKLVWETQIESMGANELDAFINVHGISCIAGRSVNARRKAAVAAFHKIHQREASGSAAAAFREGDAVQLHGLNKQSMNGMLATVVKSEVVNGRLQVRLVGDKNRYNIRPENLQAAPKDLD